MACTTFPFPKGTQTFIETAVLTDCYGSIDKLKAAVFCNGLFSPPLEN